MQIIGNHFSVIRIYLFVVLSIVRTVYGTDERVGYDLLQSFLYLFLKSNTQFGWSILFKLSVQHDIGMYMLHLDFMIGS